MTAARWPSPIPFAMAAAARWIAGPRPWRMSQVRPRSSPLALVRQRFSSPYHSGGFSHGPPGYPRARSSPRRATQPVVLFPPTCGPPRSRGAPRLTLASMSFRPTRADPQRRIYGWNHRRLASSSCRTPHPQRKARHEKVPHCASTEFLSRYCGCSLDGAHERPNCHKHLCRLQC
jgi:hypothetical protein